MASARRRRPERSRDDVLKRVGFAWLAVAAVVAALAGCGGAKKAETDVSQRVYFLRDGRVQPVLRMVPAGTPTISALAELSKGPTAAERRVLGLTNAVNGTYEVDPAKGVVKRRGAFTRAELAQIVYTITQRNGATAVVDGHAYTRKDFEDETPIILVESPLPFAHATSPLQATGTANTFEATFQYDLRDADGNLLKTHFVTATSGTGTRGTFDFSVSFASTRAGTGKLVVYELSAKDGSRIHQVVIPVELTS